MRSVRLTKYFVDVYEVAGQQPVTQVECYDYISFVRQRNMLAIRYCSGDHKLVCGEVSGLDELIHKEVIEKGI